MVVDQSREPELAPVMHGLHNMIMRLSACKREADIGVYHEQSIASFQHEHQLVSRIHYMTYRSLSLRMTTFKREIRMHLCACGRYP
jgi:hypothetical protein